MRNVRKIYTPNYRTQKFQLGMLLESRACCGNCSHSKWHYRRCYCNFLHRRTKRIEGQFVKFYAICDRYEKMGCKNESGIPTEVHGVLEVFKKELKEEVYFEPTGNAVKANGVHTAGLQDGRAASTVGKAHNLRITSLEKDKTITITIPRQENKGI